MESVEVRVSAAELVRQFGRWQQAAASRPVFVTHHGRDRFVLQSAASYATQRSDSSRIGDPPGADDILLDQLAEGYVAFDANLQVVAINPAAAAYLRLPRGEVVGMRLFEEHLPLRRSLLFGHLLRALGAGAVAAFDTPSPIYPGRWLAVKTFPLRGDGVACLLRDTTDSVVERREIDAAEALRAAIAVHGKAATARISPRGTLEAVDDALGALIGLPTETLNRARLIDILAIGQRRAAGDALEGVLAGGEARGFQTALLSNEGVEIPARLALAPITHDDGPPEAVALITAG